MFGNKFLIAKRYIIFLLFVIGLNERSVAQIIENPVFDRKDVPEYRVEKVECTKDTTYVYCSYSAEAGSWANMSKDTYLRDVNTNIKYPLLKCIGLPYGPEKKDFIYNERCEIILCFKPINNVKKIDLIEIPNQRAFNIYGIDLNNQYLVSYMSNDPHRLFTKSSFYDSAGDTIKAIQFKKDEIEAVRYVYGIASEEYMEALSSLCILYDKYGFQKEMEELANFIEKKSKVIWRQKDWNYALHMRTIASFYSHSKMYEKSIENYKECINTFESLDIIDNEYAIALRFLSSDYVQIGDFKESIEIKKKCIKVRRELKDGSGFFDELENALLDGDDKEYVEERIQIVEHELNNLPSFVDTLSSRIAVIRNFIASLYNQMNNYTEAIKQCDLALTVLQKGDHDSINEYNEILFRKCRYLMYNGQKKEALEIGLSAKRNMDSLNQSSPKYAKFLTDLANLFAQNYDYENAIVLLKSACDIFEKELDWMALASALQSIGEFYKCLLDLENAEENIKNAVDLISQYKTAQDLYNSEVIKMGNNDIDFKPVQQYYVYTKSLIYSSLARLYETEGKYAEAIDAETISYNTLKELPDEDSIDTQVTSICSLSNLLYQSGHPDEAIEKIKECIDMLKRKGNSNIIMPQIQLSFYYLTNGDYKQAIVCANDFINLLGLNKDYRLMIAANSILSKCYQNTNAYDRADSCYTFLLDYLRDVIIEDFTSMNNLQKQRMWDVYKTLFIDYRDFVCKSPQSNSRLSRLMNYIIFQKGLLLDSERKNNNHKKDLYRVNWEDIQKKLKDEDIVIEFFAIPEDSIHNTYYALVIDKYCTYPNMITLFHESDYEKIKENSTKTILDIVGNLIWKPIIDRYTKIENIYFSPEGVVHYLPIEHSNVEGVGEMIDHYNMYRLTSTKELLYDNQGIENRNAVLYGGLDYDLLMKEPRGDDAINNVSFLRSINSRGGFDPLLNTLEEVQEISSILNANAISTELFTGIKGTEDSFKNLSGSGITLAHISTHGMFVKPEEISQRRDENNYAFLEIIKNEKDPVKEDIELTHSFLVMSGGNQLSHRESIESSINDGILTALEISHLDFSKLDLVVLSACETGLGTINHEGVYGLQRGFKKAGANTILMSVNKVDDEATKILMVEFYRNLMNGKSKYQSLKDAQKHLRQVENGKYDNPKYWTSFIMLDGLN